MTTNITTGAGTAHWLIVPDDYLIDSTPGARKAEAAWLALNEAATPLRATRRDASYALVRARGEFSTTAVEDAEAVLRAAENALAAHGAKAKRALQHLDDLLRSAVTDAARAAAHALDKQAEAEAALAALLAALDARDAAYVAAGSPGIAWNAPTRVDLPPYPAGDLGFRVRAFNPDGFVTAIASGERVATPVRVILDGKDITRESSTAAFS